MWFSVGISKVEAITSPLMERCISVTSSGRSSTSRHIKCTSGLFAVIAAAISLSTVVLPAFGGLTIKPRWPLPIGETRSMTRAVMVDLPCSMVRHSSGNTGVDIAELDARRLGVGRIAVDETDLLQCGVFLVRTRRTRLTLDIIAFAKTVAADGGQAHVHIVLAGQVALRAKETVPVGHDVEHALDLDEALGAHGRLEDLLDELRLLQARDIQLELRRFFAQFGHLELGEVFHRGFRHDGFAVMAAALPAMVVAIGVTVAAVIAVVSVAILILAVLTALAVLFALAVLTALAAVVALVLRLAALTLL